MNQQRKISRVVNGMAASDGAGVKLSRVMGQPGFTELDPFLLFDHFSSDNPDDYIAGFPPHPHRGFETVTYLIAGRLRHKDNTGAEDVIEAGGIQWMTAGRGIIHSEMPEQENGQLSGFQLWINLPASHKMMEAGYQEYGSSALPVETRDAGVSVKVIAGTTSTGTASPVQQPLTQPLYIDVSLNSGEHFAEPIAAGHAAFIYVVEGQVEVGKITVDLNQLAVLSEGDLLELQANCASRFLLIAAKSLHEPVVRGGPFVMNTEAELQQAFTDYQRGQFV